MPAEKWFLMMSYKSLDTGFPTKKTGMKPVFNKLVRKITGEESGW